MNSRRFLLHLKQNKSEGEYIKEASNSHRKINSSSGKIATECKNLCKCNKHLTKGLKTQDLLNWKPVLIGKKFTLRNNLRMESCI